LERTAKAGVFFIQPGKNTLDFFNNLNWEKI
jgi:hypothetical protein